MPSGKTHDAITLFLALPVFGGAWLFTNLISSILITITFLLGGLMFGPDLDTYSKQYTRWGIFRFSWYPYRVFFKHRSRWSHGILFGTLFRVIYFMGLLTLISFICLFLVMVCAGRKVPEMFEFVRNWRQIGLYLQTNLGRDSLYFTFFGLWLGAASHTIADIAVTFIKTGRIGRIL